MPTFNDLQVLYELNEILNKARADSYERLNQELIKQLMDPIPRFIYTTAGPKEPVFFEDSIDREVWNAQYICDPLGKPDRNQDAK